MTALREAIKRLSLVLSSVFLCAACPPGLKHDQDGGLCYYTSRYITEPPVNGLQQPFSITANGFSPKRIHLGKLLFFDPYLSGDKKSSCATCHNPHLGFSDGRAQSLGFRGKKLPRSAPSLWNVAFQKNFFWDGRAISLEEQMEGPLFSPDEMNTTKRQLENELNKNKEYRRLFAEAFRRSPALPIKWQEAREALATFERTLVSLNSPYDRYVFGEKRALTPEQEEGHNLFRSFVTRCTECHTPPLFTNHQLITIGAPDLPGLPTDRGAGSVMKNPKADGMFKVPTLRNIARTAPYMHSGVFTALLDVVHFYNRGAGRSPLGTQAPNIHWHMREMGLSRQEEESLVLFLTTLNDESAIPEIPLQVPSGLMPISVGG
jgi:cytochrome c peroxidase